MYTVWLQEAGAAGSPAQDREAHVRLVNGFQVNRPVDEAWPVLTDIERLVTCIPGASLRSRDGDTYEGEIAVRVGPVSLKFEGAAEVVALDGQAHTMSVRGRGRERGGQGNVEALITMTMTSAPGRGTAVTVRTDLDLGGKVAQFGAGLIEMVSGRIIKQFVARLDAQLAGKEAGTEMATTANGTARDTAGTSAGDPDLLVPAVSLAIAAVGAFLFGLAWRRARR
ncbi:SRPBCC family protein [Amycolatopsis taiwanensis]|uniref:SRPBCC family protein n=1 Tax=Amycolatopsis taiwanensis TaxID=342230 RepID=UPI000693A1AF|nr:SRPBCC family protein [Amycolatopsis taiwanensis]